MEVKPGYKQTEVGVIPETWQVKLMDSLTSLMTNGFVGTATSAYVSSDDGVLYIQGYNVLEGSFDFHGIKRVSKSFHTRNQKSCLREGDLLTIQTGEIGVTTIVPQELVGANCHALVISRFIAQDSDPNFYCHYFNSERGRAKFKEIETGTTMKHLNVGDMKSLLLPSPPVPEQRAIATALSDADAWIESLEQLIAKKRQIKQGAMQELLTGKRRLPGFEVASGYKQTEFGEIPEDWNIKCLGELAAIRMCRRILAEQTHANGDVPFFKIGTFGGTPDAFIPARLYEEYRKNYPFPRNGDILLSAAGTLGRAIVYDGQDAYFQDSNIVWLDINKRIVRNEFLYFCYQRIEWAPSEGSTISRLYNGIIRATRILLPTSVEEQLEIAGVLSDADTEIVMLETKLSKARQIKQGMMQELLTGKIRLI